MTVRKSLARLLSSERTVIGEGRAYLHLARPEAEPQEVQGTLSLDWWDDASDAQSTLMELVDGPTLALDLKSDKLSGCVTGRILRYKIMWPGS